MRGKIILNGEGAILGRLGSYVAKELLKGNEVIVINSEKVIISGCKKDIVGEIINLRQKGGSSQKGPRISKDSEKFLKRKIRGMLPWKKAKGRTAYKRLKCYVGEGNLKKEEIEKAENLKHKRPFKFLTIKQISQLI